MYSSLIVAALAGAVSAIPQVASTTSFAAPAASGCTPTFQNGAPFEVGIVNATAALAKRQVGNRFMLTLSNGVLTDSLGRTGYIASSEQLQFDNPVQPDALITSGFSACPNGTLALASALFYECLTTNVNGSYFNLYDTPIGGQCDPAFIMIIPQTPVTTSAPYSMTTVTATSTLQPVSQLGDGQPIVATASSTYTSVMTIGTGTGTMVLPPYNSTSGLMPFNAGSSLQPVFMVGGVSLTATIAGAIGLAALLL